MFILRLLGGLRLENGSNDLGGRATQRRRLALLAVLGLTPARRLTRDRVISILWPEVTEEEGRSRLSSAVYDLRRLLGEDALGGGGDEIWITAETLRVDAVEFRNAVTREDWKQAESLYLGPLLDGVHLPDSAEFEEWIAGHRAGLQRQYAAVLEQLARASGQDGDWAGAAERWRRLVELEPLSERYILGLMRALAEAGDRAGAIRASEQFTHRLQQELGAGPDPAVSRLEQELRTAPSGRSAPLTTARVEAKAPPSSERDSTALPFPPTTQVRKRPWHRVAVGFLLLVAVAGLAWRLRPPASAARPDAVTRIAVLPFTVTGDSGIAFLRDGLVDLLSADLDGLGSFAAVDPHSLLAVTGPGRDNASLAPRDVALRLGATRYVVGSVFGLRDTVRLQASLWDASTGRLLRDTRVSGSLDAIPSLVDAVTAQLAAAELRGAGNRIASVAALTTLSIPALREFLAGESHFRQGRFGSAIESYRRAVAEDPTFALAHYRLSLAILWGNHPGATTEYDDSLAREHAARLSPRDRSLVEAYGAWRVGRAAEARARYDAIVSKYPDDVEAWYQLGETLFHYGPQLGLPVASARFSLERVVALDPIHWGARWHLALLDAKDSRPDALRLRVRELLALHPDSSSALEMQLIVGTGSTGGAPPSLRGVGELVLFGAAWRRAVFLRDYDGAERLLDEMTRNRSSYSRMLGWTGMGELALARGRWETATRHLHEAERAGGFGVSLLQVYMALIPGFERSPAERDSLERLAEGLTRNLGQSGAANVQIRASIWTLLGCLRAASGDSAAALGFAARVESVADRSNDVPLVTGWAHTVRAYTAYLGGRYQDALDELVTGEHITWYGIAVTSLARSQSLERYLRAESLRQLGRSEEALGWYASLDEHAIPDLMFLVPALLRSAQINERLGRPDLATEQYGRAAALWRGADSLYLAALQSVVRPLDGRVIRE